jgi:hypothetical protein
MNRISQWKGWGYLTSVVSVLLLAIPGFSSAMRSPTMLAAMVLGCAASICGMAMRWHSHRLEMAEKGKR